VVDSANEPGSNFTESYVDADGFHVRYLAAGPADGEPLLVLHGAGGLRTSRAQELLAGSRRLFVLELPGFGQSEPNDRTGSAREMARTVDAAAAQLGLEAYDVLGTSMGGVVALWLAIESAARVRTLVLEAPGAFRPDVPPPQGESPEALARRFNVHPERLGPVTPPDPAIMQRTWPLVMKLMGPAHDEELARLLAGVAIPTLVLYGTRDGVFPPVQGATYQRLMPNAFFSYVYDAAHDIQGDRPEAFAGIVSDFLTRQATFLVREDSALINS
jgi:pimeloyl-ACP methyl ester carboxylesterase